MCSVDLKKNPNCPKVTTRFLYRYSLVREHCPPTKGSALLAGSLGENKGKNLNVKTENKCTHPTTSKDW